MRTLFFSIVFFVSIAMNAQSNTDYTKGIVDFSILTLDGKEFTQEQLTNDEYKLLMYFNPSCSSCKAAFKKINAKADELSGLPVHYYPISLGNKEETLDFFEQYSPELKKQVDMTLLLEKDFQFSDIYEVSAYPTLFLYKPNGDFVGSYMGYEKSTDFLEHFDR